MWHKCREAIHTLLKRHLTNENRSKIAIIGAGCSYTYLNGGWMYMNFKPGASPNSERLDGPIPQLFIGDILSHFSPYMLPAYVKGDCISEILRKVSTDSTDLRERILTYLCLNKILRNRICVRNIFCGPNDFGPIMKDILSPKKLPVSASMSDPSDLQEPELLFNIKINCLEKYLEGIPKENRQVDYDDLVLLINLAKLYPSPKSQEKVSNILRLCLENKDNCITVSRKEFEMYESCQLIQDDVSKSRDMVLRYLYSIKANGPWFFAIFDEAHSTAVNNAISIDSINNAVKPLGMVLSPLNTSRWKFESFQTVLSAVEISYAYSFLRNLLSRAVPGSMSGHKLKTALIDGLKTSRGVLIYHVIYSLQGKIIHSESYFKDDSYMLPMSFLICSTSWMALSALSITHRYFLFPALLHKFFN